MTVPIQLIMPPPEQLQQQPAVTSVVFLPHPLSGDTISPAYIHTVQHLIEKCLLFNLDREECAAALERHAQVTPAITRTVWNELEKANSDFFTAYNMQRRSSRTSSSSSYYNNTNTNVAVEPQLLNKAFSDACTNISTNPSIVVYNHQSPDMR